MKTKESSNMQAEMPESSSRQPNDTAVTARPPRNRPLIAGIIVLVLVCIGLGVGGMALYNYLSTPANNSAVTKRPSSGKDGNKIVTQEEADISSVAEKVSPSVVSVLTTSQSDSFFGTAEQDGAGTGIIVGKNGYVMTNKHVVQGANTVSVVLSDGTSYDDVQVIGTDPLNDVAFLKIPNVSNLPTVELGDSTTIRVGQQVVAIGNSLGQYQNTVTSGIISGTGRPVSAQAGSSVENLTDLIQTDAAINPGNSGGPLLNLQGQVIGINTATVEDAQGIGFAIPIGATKGILKGVLAGNGVRRAYLGVNYVPITADVAQHYKLSVKQGAYVYNGNQAAVVSGSPAAKAGLRAKDVVTKVNGLAVGQRGSLSTLVGEYAPGDTIELTVLRGGQTLTLKVTLASYNS